MPPCGSLPGGLAEAGAPCSRSVTGRTSRAAGGPGVEGPGMPLLAAVVAEEIPLLPQPPLVLLPGAPHPPAVS